MMKIKNLEDLRLEKVRLRNQLILHKRDLREEIELIKAKFRPFTAAAGWLARMTGTPTNGQPTAKKTLLTIGANAGIDLLVGSKLKKAGWFTRVAIPWLLKGISATVVNRKVK